MPLPAGRWCHFDSKCLEGAGGCHCSAMEAAITVQWRLPLQSKLHCAIEAQEAAMEAQEAATEAREAATEAPEAEQEGGGG